MLIALIAILTVANVIAAVAPNFAIAMAARVLVGFVIGAYWSITAGIGARLVGTAHARRATTIIFSAVPLGSVLGVPLGTLLGDAAGWRVPFLAAAALTAATLIAATIVLPPLAPHGALGLRHLAGLVRRRGVQTGLLSTSLIVLAHFGTYSYVRPFLEDEALLNPTVVGALLLVYGAAGIAGNTIAGRFAPTRPEAALAVAAAAIAASLTTATILAPNHAIVVITISIWGAAYGAIPAATSSWFSKALPDHSEPAAIYFTASFQATISLGALLGGALLDHSSLTTLYLAGALLAMIVAIYATHIARHPQQFRPIPASLVAAVDLKGSHDMQPREDNP
ncbi:MFS transporter [Luethyella okanaganae]|uniref:MFS transporter n=1 Tax=Luethyella okanaganae TaxID=69372 RepID=A0ABW1VD95_9MICO